METDFSPSMYEGLTTQPETPEVTQPQQEQGINQNDFLSDLYEGLADEQGAQPQTEQKEAQPEQPQQPEQTENVPDASKMFLNPDGSFNVDEFGKFANMQDKEQLKPPQPEQTDIEKLKAKLQEYESKLNGFNPQQTQQPTEQKPSELDTIKTGFDYVFNLANQYEALGYPKDQAKQLAMQQIEQQINQVNQQKTIQEQLQKVEKELQEIKSKPDLNIQYEKYLNNCTELAMQHGFKSNKNMLDTLVSYAGNELCTLFEAKHPEKANLKGNEYNNAVLNFLQYEVGQNKQLLNTYVKMAKAEIINRNFGAYQKQLQSMASQNTKNNNSANIQGKSVMSSAPSKTVDPFMQTYKDIFGDSF